MKFKILDSFIRLSSFYKLRLIGLLIIMIASISFDVLSIGSVFPLINFIMSQADDHLALFDSLNKIVHFDKNDLFLVSISIIFILFLFKNLFLLIYTKISSNFIAYLTIYHQEKILLNMLGKDYSFFSKKNSSYFLREFQIEIKLITSSFIQPILGIILNILTLLGFTILLYFIDSKLTLVTLIFGLLFFLIFVFGLKKQFVFFGNQRRIQNLKIITYIKQIFEGIRELKIYKKENIFIHDLKKSWFRLANLSVKKNIFTVLPRILFEILLVFIILVVFFKLENPQNFIPKLTIFVLIMLRVIPNINLLIKYIQQINFSESAIKDLIQYFEQKKSEELKNVVFNKNIKIEDVSFKYHEDLKIFQNLYIDINKNSCIGIKGSNGSGKSTFVDVISGLIKPSSGKILIDGVSYDDLNKENWISKFGYVQQKPFFFEESLEFNITLEKDQSKIDRDKLNKSIRIVGLDDFLLNRKSNLNEKLMESATNISGGQAQKIGIARALYNSTEIMVFDEAFNNLDRDAMNTFLKIINSLKKNHTIIIISHIEEPFKECDEIYEIADKKLNKIK